MSRALATFALLPCALATPAAADPATTDAPPPYTVEVVTQNGSGCRAPVAATRADDGTALTLSSEFDLARRNGDARPTDLRKNCQVAIRVESPAGWTFATRGISVRGYAVIGSSLAGLVRTSRYVAGTAAVLDQHALLPGEDSWSLDSTAPSPFAPCGASRLQNVTLEWRLSGQGQAPSYIGPSTVILPLEWKRC